MSAPARSWVFTSFADAEPFAAGPLGREPDGARGVLRYTIYQREVAPTTGRAHWQGYVEFHKPQRRGRVQVLLGDPGAHLEPRRASRDAARAYCCKPDTRAPGADPIEIGDWRAGGQGRRSDLACACALVEGGATLADVAEEHPVEFVRYHRGLAALDSTLRARAAAADRPVATWVLVGDAGVGKTRLVYATYGAEAIFALGPDGSERAWFDGYTGQPVLLLDDFYGGLPYAFLLRLLDRYPLRVPTKGGHAWAAWRVIVITSNKAPADWYRHGMTDALLRRLTNIQLAPPYTLPALADHDHFEALVGAP